MDAVRDSGTSVQDDGSGEYGLSSLAAEGVEAVRVKSDALVPAPTLEAETVLPRPVEELPSPAVAAGSRKLADKLTDLFALSDEAATALAVAVVDPSTVRRAVETPERLAVPGGVLFAVRADVWARQVMPDPRNPRIGPVRRFPASRLVGRDEGTRFPPLPEPQTAAPERAELVVEVQSHEHLAWAAGQAREYVLNNNDWRDSIRQQGVMSEVWLAAVTFQHRDGSDPVTVPISTEGSSRLTGVHDLLGVRSSDVPYLRDERKLRARIRALNETLTTAGDPSRVGRDDAIALRCETLPALLLVGFEPHRGYSADFAVAVKSLVALRHVDPPRPWGTATENEALGDAVINELHRRGLITSGKARWLVGEMTPEEAAAAGFSDDPTVRAATIARLLTNRDPEVYEAVRVAITSQSTRKRITSRLLFEIGTSLVLRSLPEEDMRRRERIRRWLKDAYSVELVRDGWTASFRSADELAEAALTEIQGGVPGSASRELAARSAYPLVVDGRLLGDRGATGKEEQPDRRKPGEVLERMRTLEHGVRQLQHAVNDFTEGQRIRAVAEDGSVLRTPEGGEVVLRDADLRRTFAPPGAPSPTPAPETTTERLHNALAGLGQAVAGIEAAVKHIESVQAEDGSRAIEMFGADQADCETWTTALFAVLQRLPVWAERHTARTGVSPGQGEDSRDELEDLDADWDLEDDEELAPSKP